MKIVSQNFLDAQAAASIIYFFEVNMYRRYWDVGTQTYKWETNPTDLKPYMVDKGIGNINWQLDTEGLNVWKTSNVTLALKNVFGEFNEGSGLFFNDTYQRYRTRIEIKIGCMYTDGTTEDVYSFTGIIIDNVAANQDTQTITLFLSGKEIILTLVNAEDVANKVIGETIGTGALISTFTTQKLNVLSVQTVYKNGSPLDPNTDYTLTNLYSELYGVTINFTVAPNIGDVITCDYTWGNNQKEISEQVGTGATQAVFNTSHAGVGFIDNVYIDGELINPLDYTVGNINNATLSASITFTIGLGIGQTITCDYRYWYQNIDMATLIGYLLDASEFPSTDRFIDTIDVGALLKYKVWTTKLDFDTLNSISRNADTGAKIGDVVIKQEDLILDVAENDNITISGSFPNQNATVNNLDWNNKYDCNDLPQNATPVWTRTLSGTITEESISDPAGSLNILFTGLAANADIRYSRVLNNISFGEIRLKMGTDNIGADPQMRFYITFGNVTIGISWDSSHSDWAILINSQYNQGFYAGINSNALWPDYHTVGWKYNYLTQGIDLYFDGVLKYQWSSTFIPDTNFYFGMTKTFGFAAVIQAIIDYVYYDTVDYKSGKLVSNPINLGALTSNLGNILLNWIDPSDGSTLQFYLQTSSTEDFSSDGSIYPVTFSANIGTLNVMLKKYIRSVIVLTTAITTSPSLTLLIMPAHLTAIVDCGTNLSLYNTLAVLSQNNNGIVNTYSASSSNNISYNSELAIVAGVITSLTQRYIQLRTVLSYTALGSSPILNQETFTYSITAINITMADFTGQTVSDVIHQFALILDYEIGCDTSGKYFFRRKNQILTPVMQLSSSTNIISMDNDSTGWNRIKNYINVVIGKFNKIISPIILGTPKPHTITKYGTIEYDINNSNITIDDDLDLASGLALIYYNRYSQPKRQMRLKCPMLPQLELSDTININYTAANWSWFWGDSSTWWKDPSKIWFKKTMLPVTDLVANVVGLELDTKDWQLYISIREI